MRAPVDPARLRRLLRELGRRARGYERDVADVAAMLERGLVTRAGLLDALEVMKPELLRYPALDPAAFERRVREVAGDDDA